MNYDITFEMLFLELGSKPPGNLKTLSTFPIALLSNNPDMEQNVLNPQQLFSARVFRRKGSSQWKVLQEKKVDWDEEKVVQDEKVGRDKK